MSDLSLQPILVLLSQSAARNPSQYMIEKTFLRHQLEWRYLSVEVADEGLEDAVRGMRAMGFAGGNCARPHNRRIAPFLDRLGTAAERAGTVNMIWRDGAELVGENTEGKGLLQAVEEVRDSKAEKVVLFGAGAVGRAAAFELAEAGAQEIVIVNRSEERADSLAGALTDQFEVNASRVPWEGDVELPDGTDLLINATPAGAGTGESLPGFDWRRLSPEATVVDTNLEETAPELLREATERGLGTVNGLSVFLEQAALNFQLWTQIDPERAVMREAVEEYLEL